MVRCRPRLAPHPALHVTQSCALLRTSQSPPPVEIPGEESASLAIRNLIDPPDIDLFATGPIASDPTFQAHLAEEERGIQDELDILKFYPVLSISLVYRF